MIRAILALAFLFSANAFAEQIASCAYTNDGWGGDEGYEIKIEVNNKGVFEAVISVIDPGGENIYARIPVKPEENGSGSGFVGSDFQLRFYSYLPTVGDEAYTFAYFEIPTEFDGKFAGGTLCSGSAVR